MPASIGKVELPRTCPHFLALRVAVRPFFEPKIVVGLSGGADSLALTAAARAEGIAVHAVCVNHQLQQGSHEVAVTAAKQAEAMGCTAEIVPVSVEGAGGLEAAARTARYEVLGRYEESVWVAHTMNDQAETYLLGALRGNPTGMLPTNPLGTTRLVRPLLKITRAQTEGACAELGIRAWRDPHNDNESFRRVAIRKQTIPELGRLIGGDAVEPLAQAASRAAQLQDFARLNVVEPNVASLSNVHPAVRRESIAQFLRENVGQVSVAAVDAVERLVTQWSGQGPVAVGRSSRGRSARGRIWVRRVGDSLQVESD